MRDVSFRFVSFVVATMDECLVSVIVREAIICFVFFFIALFFSYLSGGDFRCAWSIAFVFESRAMFIFFLLFSKTPIVRCWGTLRDRTFK